LGNRNLPANSDAFNPVTEEECEMKGEIKIKDGECEGKGEIRIEENDDKELTLNPYSKKLGISEIIQR
jgi:hypothetical protein